MVETDILQVFSGSLPRGAVQFSGKNRDFTEIIPRFSNSIMELKKEV